MKTIMITGATAGIGEATARLFSEYGYRLIITGRRKERLEQLADELLADCMPLAFDVRDRNAVAAALDSLEGSWREIDVLVNNAGLALAKETIQDGEIDDWDTMMDTNVKGLLYISRHVMPWMIERGKGHIINIGSTAGKEVYPGGGVYCASKHAVHAISKSMRIDLLPHGIKVTNVAPGMVDTEFSLVRFKGDEEKAEKVYQGFEPLAAKDVASVIGYVVNVPAHVVINDIELTCLAQANSYLTHRN